MQSRTELPLATASMSLSFRKRKSGCSTVGEDEPMVTGIEVDRLSFINTALCAVPGNTLRAFFAPVMAVRLSLLRRRRLTQRHLSSPPARSDKMFQEGVRVLTKALVDASLELLETPMPLDEKELATALRGKLTPVCYEPGAVLAYPGEVPEGLFVHVVLSGSVQVVNYQTQNRKGPIADSSKRQYFFSNDLLRLNGLLGLQPELFRLVSAPVEIPGDAASDVVSNSTVSTSIQRTLRRASRIIGQPTLLATRTELFRAPYVCCAAEALGLEPFRLATVTAEAASPDGKRETNCDSRVTVTMRVRANDLHNALIEIALRQRDKSKTPVSQLGTLRNVPGLLDYIAAARVKSISRHYPLNEILMRQSWLLQDTPAHTIRFLVTHLTPRFYFPGEVILCPHSMSRQLCFLRRGTLTIEEPPSTGFRGAGNHCCGDYNPKRKILQEVPVGASFGELSVLFGEPRQFVLRAQTACDVWCLSCQSFAATVRRDDALRRNLLSKAAALRMRWLGEQRFTSSLARVLRDSCELFREAPDSFIRLVQERMEPVVYPPGTLLTSISTRCMEMLIILHGRVTSIVDGVAEYGPGSVIGEPTIIEHRWPLGLVSKSMVEGWKLTRFHLRDALRRIEILRRHSGEVGTHAPQLMQNIFVPPVPPCELDAVGRSRMPVVDPPPRGRTYMEFARWLAEIQLKAMCFQFRDFVKWSDISYNTLPGEVDERPSTGPPTESTEVANFDFINYKAVAAGNGVKALRRVKKNVSAQPKSGRAVNTGSILPFYVNPAIAHQPFTEPYLRKPPSMFGGEAEPLLARQRALAADQNASVRVTSMPQLEKLKKLLENRDKLRRVETKQQELAEMQQERVDLGNVSRFGCPAPVHIFLRGNKPRVQITVEEAIGVGYVLQFPDTKSIQSCVSNIDSDVTIGLPHHRQRRRDMALTPNFRHHRRCFLFAASQLKEKSKEEAMLKEAAVRDAEKKENAQHLATLLMNEMSEKQSSLCILRSAVVGEGSNTSAPEWQRNSLFKSSSRGTLTPKRQSIASRHCSLPAKEQEEPAFLRQLRENPERAMNSLRSKLSLPRANTDGEAAENNFSRSISEANNSSNTMAQGNDLMERLRGVSGMHELKKTEASVNGIPPRRPSDKNGEKETDKTGREDGSPLASFIADEKAPLFVDGYGQLGNLESGAVEELPANSKSSVENPPFETNYWDAPSISNENTRDDNFASISRSFVMPTVREATLTMRRMQRNIDGLNAVAEEQKRERLQRLRRRVDCTDALLEDASILAEYQRIVEDWAANYAQHARDPLYVSEIPPLLLPEAGADYLAEEYQHIRRQQLTELIEARGTDGWHGEIEAKDRRAGKDKSEADKKSGRRVTTLIGAKKLGIPSKPLRNPLSHLSPEEYERWVAERDAVFAAAKRPS
ncbi:hypothetical protein TCSYLVIO_004278 [Trypanosoma cruzi]|nr:hypothetical protein TCSYLVIO_004278 [Trypanosoma cruzi]